MKTDSTENMLVGSRTTEKHGIGGNEETENSLDRKQKSILVIDTPTNCNECPLVYWGLSGWTCKPTRTMIDDDAKPYWCPLKRLPNEFGNDIDDHYAIGWNDCLKELQK